MIRLKSIFIYLRALLTFFIIGPILLFLSLIYTKLLYLIVVPWCRLMIFMFGCKVNVQGEFPEGESFVIMANHQSFLDVFAIPVALKGRFSAVAASKNFSIPVYRNFLKKLKQSLSVVLTLVNGCKIIQSASLFFAISINFKYSSIDEPCIVMAIGIDSLQTLETNSMIFFFLSIKVY